MKVFHELIAEGDVDIITGNCGEMAMIAFFCVAQKDSNPNIELMGLQQMSCNVNHSFLVIGRDPGTSNARDPKTWSRDVVICDPWAKKCYSVLKIQDEMNLIRSVTAGVINTDVLYSHPQNTIF